MKKTTAVFLFIFLALGLCAQENNFKKIAASLQKELAGKPMLGGLYDSPCNGITEISISEKGELLIKGSEEGCNKRVYIKDASITKDEKRVMIYQSKPRIDITFYSNKPAVVLELLMELKKELNKE